MRTCLRVVAGRKFSHYRFSLRNNIRQHCLPVILYVTCPFAPESLSVAVTVMTELPLLTFSSRLVT